MRQYHVFQREENGIYEAVDTTGCNTVAEVEARLPPGVNWYGTTANSPEDAITEAKKNGAGLYKTPEYLNSLLEKANKLNEEFIAKFMPED